MKTMHKDDEVVSLTLEQRELLRRELRRELREHISREERGRGWRLEALERIYTASQADPATFHRLWIQPLLRAGLSLEAAIAHIVDSYLQPS